MKSKNCFFVDYPRLHIEEVEVGGIVLLKDPAYKPEENLVLHGTVKYLPSGLNFEFRQMEGKIQVGDKVYFKYLAASEHNMTSETGEKLLKVPVDMVFCYVRDGVIHPHAGHALSLAVFDEDVINIDVEGKNIKGKVSESGLVTEIGIMHDEKVTKIAYIDHEWVSNGDTVIMDTYCDDVYEVEGKEYFIIHEENILAKVAEKLHQDH